MRFVLRAKYRTAQYLWQTRISNDSKKQVIKIRVSIITTILIILLIQFNHGYLLSTFYIPK